ncbi:MAG: hypothetical protein ICV56_09060 [Nitrososphaeraceae archaeon]|nr:hypothetical protein [Nitrososphaeraceae archaeon]
MKDPLLSTSTRDIMISAKKTTKHAGNKNPRNRSLSSYDVTSKMFDVAVQ